MRREYPAACDSLERAIQRELVAIWKEETGNLVFDGFGESPCATGDDGNTADNSFRTDQTQRLGPHGRRDKCPGGFELPINSGGVEPPRKGHGLLKVAREYRAFNFISQRAITNDRQTRQRHVRMQSGKCANQQRHSFFDAQPAAEYEMRISRWPSLKGTSRVSNRQADRLGCDTVHLELALHVPTAREH